MEDTCVRHIGGIVRTALYNAEREFAHDLIEGIQATLADSYEFQAGKLEVMESIDEGHYTDEDVANFQNRMRKSRKARLVMEKIANALKSEYPGPLERPE